MRNEGARVRGMAKVFIKPSTYEAVIVFDKDRASEVLTETVNCGPPDCHACNQQRQSQWRDEIVSYLEVPNPAESEDHPDGLDRVCEIPNLAGSSVPILTGPGRNLETAQVRHFNN